MVIEGGRAQFGAQQDERGTRVQDVIGQKFRLAFQRDPVVVFARASGESSGQALAAAVNTLITGISGLRTLGFRDVEDLLPDKAELITRAKGLAHVPIKADKLIGHGGTVTSNTHDGRAFRNSIYIDDSRLRDGFVFVVMWGSGTKEDEDSDQPAVVLASQVVLRYRAALVWVNEFRAIGRTAFGLNPLIKAMRAVERDRKRPIWIGEILTPVGVLDADMEQRMFDAGLRGKREAATIVARNAAGKVTHTMGGPTHGKPFVIGVSKSMPPPLNRARMKEDQHDRIGRSKAYVDTPGGRPKRSDAAVGLSKVVDPLTGKRLDLLWLVRWFYEHYMTPGWNTLRTAEFLVSHGFTTHGTHRLHGDLTRTVKISGTTKQARVASAAEICKRIWNHREFHVTGNLVVKFDGHEVVYQVQCPDGLPMATRKQVQRIERAKAKNSKSAVPLGYLLSGLPAEVNGVATHMGAESRGKEPAWCFWIDGTRHRLGIPHIPHSTWFEWYVDAVADAPVVLLAAPDNQETNRHARELVALKHAELGSVTTERDNVEQSLAKKLREPASAAKDTSLGIYERELQRLNGMLVDAEAAVTEAETALRQEVADDPVPVGVRVDGLLALMVQLKDGRDITNRDILRLALESTKVRESRAGIMPGLYAHTDVSFEQVLRLSTVDGEDYLLPIRGKMATGKAADRIALRLFDVVERLREGIPADDQNLPSRGKWGPLFRMALWGDVSRRSVAPSVTDPRILKLVMAVVHPRLKVAVEPFVWKGLSEVPRLAGEPLTGAQRRRLAVELGEPVALLDRVAELYTGPMAMRGPWRPGTRFTTLKATLDKARQGSLKWDDLAESYRAEHFGLTLEQLPDGTVRIHACTHCGSRDRVKLRLREADGLVCLTCGLDDSGSAWPHHVYAKYEI